MVAHVIIHIFKDHVIFEKSTHKQTFIYITQQLSTIWGTIGRKDTLINYNIIKKYVKILW